MARCGVPGIDLPAEDPDDRINRRTDECGCRLVRCGPPINGWVRIAPCAEHERKEES